MCFTLYSTILKSEAWEEDFFNIAVIWSFIASIGLFLSVMYFISLT
jgi:hypothetical protein